MKHTLASLLMLATALPALAAEPEPAQSTYRWVDERARPSTATGRPQSIKKFEERRLQPNRGDAQLPFVTRKAASDFPVTLYTGRECGKPCDEGRALLTKRGIPFSETKLETTDDVAAFKARFNKDPVAPTLTVGKEMETGYASAAWERLLNDAGYPAAKR
jgi:hypothetical protein